MSRKTTIGLAVLMTALVGLGALSFRALGTVRSASELMTREGLPGVHRAGQIKAAALEEYLGTLRLLVATEPVTRARIGEEILHLDQVSATSLSEYANLTASGEGRRLLGSLTEARALWSQLRRRVVALASDNKVPEATALLSSEGKRVIDSYLAAADALVELNRQDGMRGAQAVGSAVSVTSTTLWVGILLTLIVALGAAILVDRSMTRPMTLLLEHVERIARGDLQPRHEYESEDQVGRVASAFKDMSEALATLKAGQVERSAAEAPPGGELQKLDTLLAVVLQMGEGNLALAVPVNGSDAVGQLGQGMETLIRGLNESLRSIAGNGRTLSASAEELTNTAREIATSSQQTFGQAETVSAGAEQVNKNVQTVAAGAEVMTASIKEIGRNANEATRVTSDAVQLVETAAETIQSLAESSVEIGKVIKVITSVAAQTNLLALNATIEAARAGESGKGFAVVANEVKELAKETAKATEDIRRQVEAIQGGTTAVVSAIQKIYEVIAQVNGIATTIAGAIEEQTSTTNEIGRNVNEAAQATAEIARNIEGVAQAAQRTAASATESLTATSAMSGMVAELQHLVARFQLEGGDRSQNGHQPNGGRLLAGARVPQSLPGRHAAGA